MSKVDPAADTSFFLRALHIPPIMQMLKLVYCDPSTVPKFPSPRFELFSEVLHDQGDDKPIDNLLFLILKRYRVDILVGMLLTLFWVGLNLLIPQIIRQFFSLMKLQTLQQNHLQTATYITEKYVLLQLLKAMLSGHVTRIFYELSLKVQSCLSAEITGKALRINSECRTKLPESEVYHLQKVDLKMVSKLFQHFWMLLEIPVTLVVAVVLLFRESLSFGIVGLYWIVIVFFLQREISDRLIETTLEKHGLMEDRAKFNYEIMQKIRLARLDVSESLLLEKNNNFFLRETKTQRKYYYYHSLFQITLVLLPIIVAISISIYDRNQERGVTIKEVYMLLTLLGICYKPLKNILKMVLQVEQGLHSFKRIKLYLNLPENCKASAQWIRNSQDYEPSLKIAKNTMTMLRSESSQGKARAGFYCDREISVGRGQRLVILGRKGQGVTAFLRSLLGELYTVNGCIKLQGSLTYLPQANFFRHANIASNISFYDRSMSQEEVKAIFELMGLDRDLKFRKGLEEIVEVGKFSETELKKIGLARVLCARREVYILDTPFMGLGVQIGQRLQDILRERQQQGAMIIIAQNFLRFAREDDVVMILSSGQIRQFGTYGQLSQLNDSAIHSFHSASNLALSDRISFLPVVREFQAKIKKILIMQVITEQRKKKQAESKVLNHVLLGVGRYSLKLKGESQIKRQSLKVQKKGQSYVTYFKYFVSQLPLSEWLFATLLLISAELLHIFIQYQIGQQYKKGGEASFGSLRRLINYELALTCGLALIIYLQYYVFCLLGAIIGNRVYQRSLQSLCGKNMKWYQQTPSPFIADKYNHDYQQIYTVVKFVFDFFKLAMVLATTLLLIDVSFTLIAAITSIISLFYYFMLKFFRRAEEALVRSHAAYKHDFLKVFDEIIEGGLIINIFEKNKQAIQQAKAGFISVASYKQAINSSKIVENLACEFASCLIIALGFQYGTIIKIQEGQQNEALIAVSVMLLFNLSQVLKNIMQTLVRLESFFRLKLISFIEVIDFSPKNQEDEKREAVARHALLFSEVFIKQKEDPIFQIYPLTLSISQGEKVILYEQDNIIRNNLLLALTNNLQGFSQGKFDNDVVKIGNINISHLSKQAIKDTIAVIMPENFYFSSTLQENIKWKNHHYHPKIAHLLAQSLQIERELPDFATLGLEAEIKYTPQPQRELSRKIAIIKAILRKAKIIILKDTPWIIGGVKVTDLAKEWKLNCTVIGITSDLAGTDGAERLVYMEKLKIIEDDSVEKLVADELSLSGALLRASKAQNYSFLQAEEEPSLSQVLKAEVVNKGTGNAVKKYRKANTLI